MADPIQRENILVSERGIFEVQGRKQVDGLAWAEIEHLRLAYATAANRPVLEGMIGAILFIAGLDGIWLCFQNIKGFRYYVVLLVLGVLGAGMLRDVLKRRYVIYVRARSGRIRKLSFSVRASSASVEGFLRDATQRFGLKVESDVPNIEV